MTDTDVDMCAATGCGLPKANLIHSDTAGHHHFVPASQPSEASDGWTGTWCPQCGPDVEVDEDGLCKSCGATAVGDGVEAVLKLRAFGLAEDAEHIWRITFGAGCARHYPDIRTYKWSVEAADAAKTAYLHKMKG